MIAAAALSLALAAASPREVIVLCKPADAFAINSAPPFPAISLVLDHLGLIPRFRDISKGLPDAAESARARGVLVWLDSSEVPDSEALDNWLRQRLEAHQRIGLLNGVSALTDRANGTEVPRRLWEPILEGLGLSYHGHLDTDAALHYTPARLPGAEAPLPEHPLETFDAKALTGAKVLASLELGSRRMDALVQGPNGVVSLGAELMIESNPYTYAARWRVDPFTVLGEALGVAGQPALDPTTINGRRTFFAHIDGDGFNNQAIRRHPEPAAKVILDELLGKTPLPTTVSIVASTVAGKPELESLARQIFALPNVEAASHTYSHPHDYVAEIVTNPDGAVDGGVLEEGMVPGKHVKLDPVHEVDDSIRYVQSLLPAGKRVGAMLWSGRTNPPAPYLARAAACGVANLNGGDARLDPHFPSLTSLAPYGRDVGPYLQVHSAAANENLYTNLWTGPFDGQRQVIDQFKATDEPRRLCAVDIYYHFYAGERAAGLKALQDCYRWAEAQPLAPVFASTYARMVEGFYNGHLGSAGPAAWDVSELGACRTLRFDHETREPDLAACQGVAGFTRASGDRLYVHLSGPTAHVALAEKPAPRPHLESANAPLGSWDTKLDRVAGAFEPTVPPRVVLAGFKPRQAVIVTGDFKGPDHADADGKLAVWAPLGPAKLEVRW